MADSRGQYIFCQWRPLGRGTFPDGERNEVEGSEGWRGRYWSLQVVSDVVNLSTVIGIKNTLGETDLLWQLLFNFVWPNWSLGCEKYLTPLNP